MSASRRVLCTLTHPSAAHKSSLFSFYCFPLSRPRQFSNLIMSQNQRRGGGNREQQWKPNSKPKAVTSASSSVDDAVTSASSSVDNAATSASSSVDEAVTTKLGGLSISEGQIWKPKSYGTVTGSNAAVASATLTPVDVQTEKETVDLSKIFLKSNLLENFKVDNSTYSLAQIRATFYPKFENEKSDQEIRIRMIEMVSKGLATLEVSLKHSGSLFMYAGHEGGAYAKNSFGNIYTAVGVFVLGRMFREAWGSRAGDMQAQFNDFIERNRISISMELVTAVLGDHGQRPRDDYAVVTAVTELGNGKPKFYSTPEVIAFCRKWCLPTNHVWLFSTRKSVTSFFAAYDLLYEEGTATSVCSALDEVADISVPGSKDHIKVQGEILEGLVARIVTHESTKHMEEVLKDHPSPPADGAGIDLGPSLREICAVNRTDEKQQIKALLHNVGSSFCPDHSDWYDSHSRNADRSVLSKFLQAHPADYSTAKLQEMIRLMREKRFPAAFKCYHNFHKAESVSSDNLFYKMVIHVHSDSAFRRYQKEIRHKPGLWPLYRGFFIDINLFKANAERAAEIAKSNNDVVRHVNNGSSTSTIDGLANEDSNLMIKLKFLTYKSDVANASGAYEPSYLTRASKVVNDGAGPSRNDKGKSPAHNPISSRPSRRCLVDEDEMEDEMEEDIGVSSDEGDGVVRLRTFLIRNGLSVLFKDGPAAYKAYYLRQMKIWGTSAGKQIALSKMLDEWAVYIRRKCGNRQLSSAIYLSEAEPFLEQFAKRSPENQALIGSAGNLVRTEDFLAVVEGGMDEEGDLATEREAAPESLSPSVKDTIQNKEGLIVFFPGIPGCAKSALCRELLNTPGGLGDDRPVQSLMGDLIKGRYWPKIADERKKKPYSIILADKNAPNEEVWKQASLIIENMCHSTRASAVPIIPDSEGTDSNPFALDALAVFMFRVLQRVNHPGNLDKSSPNVGYVMLMFYHLYDGKSRKYFEEELVERFGSLVKMPLLKPDRSPLPASLISVLEEGIDLYNLHTKRHGRLESNKGSYAQEWVKWEKKSRDIVSTNAEYLNSIQVPFEFAVQQVLEQLRKIAKGDYTLPSAEKKLGTVVFAAVNIPAAEVKGLLDKLSGMNADVEAFLKEKNMDDFLKKAHVTLAHKRSHGVTSVASYSLYLHRQVPVELNALLFTDKMAALQAQLGSIDDEKIISKNEWPHVTIWTGVGVQPKEANTLPQLLSEGQATVVEINPPVTISGTVEFF
ncbi:putative exonuclease V-like [Hibiscus syriacus]|uniref:Exonuclease V-like n=1 Tax=Hibiscus syriacus TaxID=106335 RepID=A0A6A2WE64_HIBSY|nr:putative exonuclease V-like [Hibiscus syriacus]